MIQYLNKLLPTAEVLIQDLNKLKEERIQEALKSEEWKKQKVEFVKSKKNDDDEFNVGGKKKDKKKNQNKEKEDTSTQPLNHQFDALNSFDSVKVSPPLFSDKINDSIKVLKEKLEYFQKLQADAIKAEDEKRAAKAEEAKQESTVTFKIIFLIFRKRKKKKSKPKKNPKNKNLLPRKIRIKETKLMWI